jgi:hypothetical protein
VTEKTEYQRMYLDLPEPVYDALQFERLPEEEMLGRPSNGAAVLLLPVDYPARDAKVPSIARKPVEEIVQWNLG